MMKEYRCKHCDWLLFKGELTVATVEVRCTRQGCKTMNAVTVETLVLDKSKLQAIT